VLGHRGGRGEGFPPENTLAAFARALAEGADGVELDVRLTADGVVAVFHDETLARATDGADARPFERVAYAALPKLAGADGGGGEPIPSLEAALDAMRGRVVNVEIKSDVSLASLLADLPKRLRLVRATVAAVRRAPGAEVVFSSFDPLVVSALAVLAPDVPRAILVGASMPRAATALPVAMRRAVVAVHLEEALATPSRVARLVRRGLRVAAWTVNDPERARQLVAAGVAWLITDRPAALARRG
jgi:glycerophosphoryl diester phosphodiesterase